MAVSDSVREKLHRATENDRKVLAKYLKGRKL